jgi:putative transposase
LIDRQRLGDRAARGGRHSPSRHEVSEAQPCDRKFAISFEKSKRRYGSPRIHAELRAEGHRVSGQTVAAIMRAEGFVARPKKRFRATTDLKHDDPIAPNIVERDVVAAVKLTAFDAATRAG